MTLAKALAALEDGRDQDAYNALAGAWRKRRSPVLAELAELLSLRSSDVSMKGTIDGLSAPRVATMHERFLAMEDVDDPLLATWVLRALEEPPFTGPSSRPLLEALIGAAVRLRDPRLLERREAILRVWTYRITPKPSRLALSQLLAEAKIPTPKAANAEESKLEAELSRRLARGATAKQTTADLFAEVYANPRDDAPRLVLADHLLEQGDPRGELIALQFKRRSGGSSEADLTREAELLKKHGKGWLGPLAAVISWGKGYSQSTFERGFLSIADIILSVGKKMELVAEDPSWAVVEEFRGLWDPAMYYRMPLRGLRKLETGAAVVKELCGRGIVFPALEELALEQAIDAETLRSCFPALRMLTMTYGLGPSIADVEAVKDLPVERVVIDRWIESAGRKSLVPIDELVDAVCKMKGTVKELAIEPPWRNLPRPNLIELRRTASGYSVHS